MLPIHVALVADTDHLDPAELCRVAAALQKQVVRDLAPFWQVAATVSPFLGLDDVPPGQWPVVILDDVDVPGVMGVHLDGHGQPFALVRHSPTWSLTASHETLEMLVDPSGSRLVAGQSPMAGQGRVEFLVEACDPCEDPAFAYTIDGVLVSDFITPHYEDPVVVAGVRYSFTGAISRPREVLPGGYLTWLDPVGRQIWQETYLGSEPEFRPLGAGEHVRGPVREWVDARTRIPLIEEGLQREHGIVQSTAALTEAVRRSSGARADILRSQIRLLTKRAA